MACFVALGAGHIFRERRILRIIRNVSRLGIMKFARQLLTPLFFLFVFLCEISLALFERVVWFGQEASSDSRNDW